MTNEEGAEYYNETCPIPGSAARGDAKRSFPVPNCATLGLCDTPGCKRVATRMMAWADSAPRFWCAEHAT